MMQHCTPRKIAKYVSMISNTKLFVLLTILIHIITASMIFLGSIINPGIVIFEDVSYVPLNILECQFSPWDYAVSKPNIVGLYKALLYPMFALYKYLHLPDEKFIPILYYLTIIMGGVLTSLSLRSLMVMFGVLAKGRQSGSIREMVPIMLSVFYVYSPVILNEITHYWHILALLGIPIQMLLYAKTILEPNMFRFTIKCIITSFFTAWIISVHPFYIFITLIFDFIITCIFKPFMNNARTSYLSRVLTLYIVMMLMIGLKFYPQTIYLIECKERNSSLLSECGIPTNITAFIYSQSRLNNYINVFLLIGGYAYFPASKHGYSCSLGIDVCLRAFMIILHGLFILSMILSCTIIKDKAFKKNLIILLTIWTFFFSLGLGTNGFAYHAILSLIKNPLVLRLLFSRPYRFCIGIALTEILMLILLFSKISKFMCKNKGKKLKVIWLVVIAIVIVYNMSPLTMNAKLIANGHFGNIFVPTIIPKEIVTSSSDLREINQKQHTRTIVLPKIFHLVSWNEYKLTRQSFYDYFFAPSFSQHQPYDKWIKRYIENGILNLDLGVPSLLKAVGIKFIVIHGEKEVPQLAEVIYKLKRNMHYYESTISRVMDGKYVSVYMVRDVKGKVYIPHNILVVENENELSEFMRRFNGSYDEIFPITKELIENYSLNANLHDVTVKLSNRKLIKHLVYWHGNFTKSNIESNCYIQDTGRGLEIYCPRSNPHSELYIIIKNIKVYSKMLSISMNLAYVQASKVYGFIDMFDHEHNKITYELIPKITNNTLFIYLPKDVSNINIVLRIKSFPVLNKDRPIVIVRHIVLSFWKEDVEQVAYKAFRSLAEILMLKKLDSSTYEVRVYVKQAPALLVFTERFDPLWRAKSNESVYNSLPLLKGFLNGFLILQEGYFDIKIYYEGYVIWWNSIIFTCIIILLLILIALSYDRIKEKVLRS